MFSVGGRATKEHAGLPEAFQNEEPARSKGRKFVPGGLGNFLPLPRGLWSNTPRPFLESARLRGETAHTETGWYLDIFS